MGSRDDMGKFVVPDSAPVLAPAPSIHQLTLFHRKTVSEMRPTNATADCAGEAEADDGLRYYLKLDLPGKHTRASEWISTHLGEFVGIAGPAAAPIQMLNGSLAFGSRRLAGVSDQITTSSYLVQPTLGRSELSGLSTLLSKIYAFDLFINNGDRHGGNYLTVPDGDVRRLYAFDYSRAFFWDWPWHGFPVCGTRTREVGTALRSCHGFDKEAANETLSRLSSISMEKLGLILESMPSEWLPDPLAQRLKKMWAGNERADRIVAIKMGMADGSLL